MTEIEIEASFDPESAADIAWITTEIEKILEDSPQIQQLETKLGMVKDADPVLTKVMNDLKRVTDITRILDEQEKLNAPQPHYNRPFDAATNPSGEESAKNATKTADANATAPASTDGAATAAPAAEGEKKTDAKAAEELPPELNPAAAGATQSKKQNASTAKNATKTATATATSAAAPNTTKPAASAPTNTSKVSTEVK